MKNEDLVNIIKKMASQPDVKNAVIKSHDENPWWPMAVSDWRMRMIIAGLSTRVSFRMLHIYKDVIKKFGELTYNQIKTSSDEELGNILKPLGLLNNRLKFLRSMVNYLEQYKTDESFFQKNDQDIINDIDKYVEGASFKVGQCCALYAKGYYCGIMPVDSGMKDMLAPCLGLKTGKKPSDHEVVRLQMEQIANNHDWLTIAKELEYDKQINMPTDKPLTWWLHLVLINYKRYFCNRRKPELCPLLKICELKKGCQR
jgi:endonuclease III